MQEKAPIRMKSTRFGQNLEENILGFLKAALLQ